VRSPTPVCLFLFRLRADCEILSGLLVADLLFSLFIGRIILMELKARFNEYKSISIDLARKIVELQLKTSTHRFFIMPRVKPIVGRIIADFHPGTDMLHKNISFQKYLFY
jgi:hypothetical protein